jgi:bifunctional DNase/RNase
MKDRFEVNIIGLSESESQKGYYVLVLEEIISKKRIPLIIGQAEAQSIAIFMEKLFPSRPLSHDLFKSILSSLNATIK